MKQEIRDGMRIDWDVPIRMEDGVVLRADVFRPVHEDPVPAILTYGPYGKGLAFQDGYKTAWSILERDYPDALAGSTNKYQSWEVPDPEKWVPDGYACVRVDGRGAGRSEGFLEVHSPRETEDLYQCIEWAGTQPWCNARVGLNGISYFAANQWRVASRSPPHLAAICVWEGFADNYRDATHHGGILSVFRRNWQEMQVKSVQHGRGTRGPRSRVTGELVCGPETLDEEVLAANIGQMPDDLLRNNLDGPYYWSQAGDMSRIEVPLLSAGNWGGQGLHLRGNIEGFVNAASTQKWLEMHGGAHWAEFYTDYGLEIQKKFFGCFLKGEETGWDRQPRVQLQIRRPGEIKFPVRHEDEWPIARTRWTEFYLDPARMALTRSRPETAAPVSFEALGEGLRFLTDPLDAEMEITGPIASKLRISSSTSDADLFLVLQVFDPEMREVVFYGALDPHTPIAQGWLRASHRKLDAARSLPYRPYHTHDELWPLEPGQPVDVDVEIWPTCIVVPKGYRIGLAIRGKDYEWSGEVTHLSNMKNPMTGCGPFMHTDPDDRPAGIFGGITTLHWDGGQWPHVLLPVIPPK